MEEKLAVGSGELIIVKQLPVIEDKLDEAYAKLHGDSEQ